MFCPHCGAAHDADAQHCPACGRSLTAPLSSNSSSTSVAPVSRRPPSPWVKRIGLGLVGLAVLLGAARITWAVTQTPQRAAAAYLAAVASHNDAAVLTTVVWSGNVASPYLHGAFLTQALRAEAAVLPRHPSWRVTASGRTATVVATGTHHSISLNAVSSPGPLGLPVWHIALTPATVSVTVDGAHSGGSGVSGLQARLDGIPLPAGPNSSGALTLSGVFPGPHTLRFSGPAIAPVTVPVGQFQSRTVTAHVAPAARQAITAVFGQFLTAYAQDVYSGQYNVPPSAQAGQGISTFLSQDAASSYGTPSNNSYSTTLKSTGDTLGSWTPVSGTTVTFVSRHSWAITYAALPACAQQLFCTVPSNTTATSRWTVTAQDVRGHWRIVDVTPYTLGF